MGPAGRPGQARRGGERGEARYWTGAIQVCRAAETLHLPREPSRRPRNPFCPPRYFTFQQSIRQARERSLFLPIRFFSFQPSLLLAAWPVICYARWLLARDETVSTLQSPTWLPTYSVVLFFSFLFSPLRGVNAIIFFFSDFSLFYVLLCAEVLLTIFS